jgi:hypothetical protein
MIGAIGDNDRYCKQNPLIPFAIVVVKLDLV